LVLQIPYGLGRHGLVVPVEDRTKFEEITFWKTVFSDGFAMGLLRISMAISLLRLKKDLKWYRWSLFAVMGTSLTPPCFSGVCFHGMPGC
jgi:ABC-type nickel/cobalt efflux system permease component RcnA